MIVLFRTDFEKVNTPIGVLNSQKSLREFNGFSSKMSSFGGPDNYLILEFS